VEYFAMTLDEKIQQYVQKLPRSFQKELLDFVEYLAKLRLKPTSESKGERCGIEM
jgi:hypothetical protein